MEQKQQTLTPDMAKRFEEMEEKVDKIYTALIGNEFNSDGFITRVKTHEERIISLEKTRDSAKWIIITLSATSGMGIIKLFETLVDAFKH